MSCPRCGVKFEPTREYHILCSDYENGCYSEVQQVELSPELPHWKAWSVLINGTWDDDQMRDMADSAGVTDFFLELMEHKDKSTMVNLLKKLVKIAEDRK